MNVRVAAALSLCSIASTGFAESTAVSECSALQSADFSQVQDAPTQVMDASVRAAVGDVPAHCHVQGYIWPQVGFELQLPTSTWNGKFLEVGGGGHAGTTRLLGKIIRGYCDDGLRRGYACIVSDQGHSSTKEGYGPHAIGDGLWAYNNLQAEVDYGFRAGHVAALAGKAITRQYYGTEPKYSYFFGCSGGGRQALVEAQRFPWDFDGIVALDPATGATGQKIARLWNTLVTVDEKGKPLFTPAALDVLHNAVMQKCDAADGLKDGVIGDPRDCRFDPAELTCKPGATSACLMPAQVAAARKVYSGPVTSTGERIFHGPPLGSEQGGSSFSVGSMPSAKLAEEFLRYMAFVPDPGPGWRGADFDFDRDYRRVDMMEALYAADNPDLRRFKSAGGKLMIAQGWENDGSSLTMSIIDYYEMVERVMGGRRATQEFARLFMIPGKGHCQGGVGANAVDYLGYLEAWVEHGRVPDMMVGAHIDRPVDWTDQASRDAYGIDWGDFIRAPRASEAVKFTRPIYPYPLRARYKGAGDPDDYRSFEAVEPLNP